MNMRLLIKENLKKNQTMRELALEVYATDDTSEVTKVSRLSAINSGRKVATVIELARISKFTGKSYKQLMGNCENW